MAQYDGSIRINTQIDSKNANAQLMSLQNRIVKAADKVESLRSKMDALKDAKEPTQEYKDLQKELSAAEKELGKMIGKEKELSALDSKIEKLSQSSSELAKKMNSAEFAGKASDEYKILESSISQAKYELESFLGEQKRLSEKGLGQDIDKKYLAAANAVRRLKNELNQAVQTRNEDAYLGIEDQLNRAKAVLQELMRNDPKPLGEIRYYDEVEKKIENLKNSISVSENKMKKLIESGKAFSIDTNSEEYKNLESEYKAVNQELKKAKQKQEELIEKQAESSDKVDEIKAKMNQLVEDGKAFTLGSDPEEFKKLSQQLKYAENDYRLLIQRKNEFEEKHNIKTDDGYERLRKSLEDLYGVVAKVASPFQALKKAFSTDDSDVSGYDRLESSLQDLKNTANNVSKSVRKSFDELRENPISASAAAALNLGNKMNAAAISAMGSTIDILGNGIARIVDKFWQMRESIGSAVDSAMETVREKMAGLAGSMINTMLHPIQTLKNVAKTSVDGVSNILKSGLVSAMEGIKERAAGVGASIINGLLHPFQTLKSVASSAINGINNMLSKMKDTVKKVTAFLSKLGVVIKKIGSTISGTFKKAVSFVSSFAGKIKELAQKHMPKFRKETEKSQSALSTFGKRIKELVMSALIFNQISAAFRAMSNGMKEGFGNLFDQVDDFRLRVNTLRASVLTLKNALAAAFRPLVEFVIPYLQKAVDYITMLVGNLGQLFAALTGQTTYTKAIKMTADYFEEEEKAAKKATKAAEGYLSPLDEINKYIKDKEDEEEEESEIKTPMFEEVPIEGKFFDIANKIKDVLSKLFAPLKAAWDKEGQFVMDSWKYALGEVWKLLKDIGRDFLTVWNQQATIDMLADMLHIVGDIGLIVGNIAKNFRAAWNYNNTGLHILENIRDIFAIIIHNIRDLADYTVEWSKSLDFKPLLTSIETLTASLKRFADFVSGTLVDFAKYFILPLTSWTLSEQGLPRLFNILAAFMNEINWEGLRAALKSLYQALEPYAEEIGNGLLDFIERIKNEGVEFFNFLPGAIQAAADSLRNGDLPAAFEQFGEIVGQAAVFAFNSIRIAIESIPWGDIGTWIGSFINGIRWEEVFSSLADAITTAVNGAIDLAYNFIMTTDWKRLGTAFGMNLQRAWDSIDWQKASVTVGQGIKGILDFLLATVQEMEWEQIGRDIGTFLSEIPWLEIFSQVFEIVWEVLSGLISGLLDTESGKIILTIGAGIVAIKGLFNAADFALTVAQWATGGMNKFALLTQGAQLLKSGLSVIMGGIGALFSPTGLLIAAIAAAVVLIVTHWDDIKETAGKLKDWVVDKFEKLKDGVKESMDKLAENCGKSWDKAQEKFQSFDNFLSGVFSHDWSQNFGAFGDVMNGFFQNASNIWESVKRIFSGVIDFVAGVFTGDWSRAWEGIKNIFGGIWEGFAGVIKTPINTIIGLANGLIDAVASMVNIIGEKLNSLKIDIPKWVPKIGGGKLSFNIPTWTPGHIPYLATGTVVPPNREFMAVLGDNKREPEVVSPLSTIEQAVENVLSRNGGSGGEITIKVPVYIGDKQVYEAVVKYGKTRQMATGKNEFMLGTT